MAWQLRKPDPSILTHTHHTTTIHTHHLSPFKSTKSTPQQVGEHVLSLIQQLEDFAASDALPEVVPVAPPGVVERCVAFFFLVGFVCAHACVVRALLSGCFLTHHPLVAITTYYMHLSPSPNRPNTQHNSPMHPYKQAGRARVARGLRRPGAGRRGGRLAPGEPLQQQHHHHHRVDCGGGGGG